MWEHCENLAERIYTHLQAPDEILWPGSGGQFLFDGSVKDISRREI
jgi:hypothetical protein